jgi:hypothetical protein
MELIMRIKVILAVLPLFTAALVAFASPATHRDNGKQIPPFKLGRPMPDTDQWVTWAWTGDQRPYLGEEQAIHNAVSHTPPRSLMAWAAGLAHAHPADPVAQFAWAYTALEVSSMLPQEQYMVEDALTAIQGVDPGNIREYAHIRCDLTFQMEPNKVHPDIEKVGDRLLQSNPRDWYTRRMMIYDLCNGTDVHKAVRLADAWVALDPKNPKPHATLAFVYQNLWFRDHKPETKNLAIEEYQRYIALAPTSDPFRARATYLIGVLSKEKA